MNTKKVVAFAMVVILWQTLPSLATVVTQKSSSAQTISYVTAMQPTGSETQPQSVFRTISPTEAMRLLQSRDDVIFLDVRTPEERAHGAIPGSKLVSIYDLLKGSIPLPKNKPILLVCAIGGRSYVVGQVLSREGYKEVYSLSGGINAWYQAGLPIVQDQAAAARAQGRKNGS